ncbi:MAG: hypothetical protein IAG10_07770 [Planctomycetaceae bacterium]|nr:hypothetical protein [Planctomycetaceae bacterium]
MQPMLLSLMLILPSQLAAEKPKVAPEANDEALRTSVAVAAKEFAGRCEFTAGESEKTKLVLYPEPVLRFSNPTAGTVLGDIFVWTENGRPAVWGNWYRWFAPGKGRVFEVTSLSERPVAGRVNDIEFWNTSKPGLALKPLPGVDAPAREARSRLVQMRRLAGDFATHLADTRGNERVVKRQLRLLPQPVFRYLTPQADATYLDGALFVFVEGTDPETILILEASKLNDKAIWQFGLARNNSDPIRVTFRDKEVWSAMKIDNILNMTREPYSSFTSEELLDKPGNNEKKPVIRTRERVLAF